MVDCTGLENRRTERYRGFESLPFRKERIVKVLSFFCRMSEAVLSMVKCYLGLKKIILYILYKSRKKSIFAKMYLL